MQIVVFLRPVTLLVLFLMAAGCRDDANPTASGMQAAPGAGSGLFPESGEERTWAGVLPCSDCQGIDTRLVLRLAADQREYLLTEDYLGGSGKRRFSTAGTWTERFVEVEGERRTLYILDPERSAQRLALQADGALVLLEGEGDFGNEPVAYRLQRL